MGKVRNGEGKILIFLTQVSKNTRIPYICKKCTQS